MMPACTAELKFVSAWLTESPAAVMPTCAQGTASACIVRRARRSAKRFERLLVGRRKRPPSDWLLWLPLCPGRTQPQSLSYAAAFISHTFRAAWVV